MAIVQQFVVTLAVVSLAQAFPQAPKEDAPQEHILPPDLQALIDKANADTDTTCPEQGITFEEVQDAIATKGIILIDLRNRREFRDLGSLPGSVNVPMAELDSAWDLNEADFETRYGFKRPSPEDTNVVLTCTGGVLVRAAFQILKPRGYCNIRLYYGSFSEWTARGGEIVKEVRGKTLPQTPIPCRPKDQLPPGILFEEVRVGLEANTILMIDVRNRSELIRPGSFPNTVNVPLHEVRSAWAMSEDDFFNRYGFERPTPDMDNVVLVCRSGNRIRFAARILERLGYCKLRLYYGSFKGWVKNGGEVILPAST